MRRTIMGILMLLNLAGCSNIPSGIEAVQNFNVSRYQGKWYEIARLDHSFERGLTDVYTIYSLRKDGGINVLNRGFDKAGGKWKQVRGRAYFTKGKTVGRLKVTFFWPFYGGYNVISLDSDNYSYALVCGPTKSYLWILAREKTPSKSIIDKLIKKAANAGFDVEGLIFVQQERSDS